MLLRSILITAAVFTSLAIHAARATIAELKTDATLPEGLSLPFNDLLPPLLSTELNTDSETASLSSNNGDAAGHNNNNNNQKHPTTASPHSTTVEAKAQTVHLDQKHINESSRDTNDSDKLNQAKDPNAAILSLPFNDLLPPFPGTEEVQGKEPVQKETSTRVSTTENALKKDITHVASSSRISSRFSSQIKSSKPDVPQKYYKKPLGVPVKSKAASRGNLSPTVFNSDIFELYFSNYQLPTPPPKTGVPTITPFPRFLK